MASSFQILCVSVISMFVLAGCDGGQQAVQADFTGSQTEAPEVAEALGDYPDGPYGFGVGDTVADIVLYTSQDEIFSLSALHQADDKRLLLIFATAGWCGRCREHMASLAQLYERRADDGFHAVVSIHENANYQVATMRDAIYFQRQHQLPFDIVADSDAQFLQFFEAFSPPLIIVIDLDTMVVRHLTEVWDLEQMTTLVEGLLAGD